MANITMRDFINQGSMYQYSTENYELMKECSELVLLEQYIDNQMFMMHNQEIFESAETTFEDGYFQEAASFSNITSIMEKAEEKKEGIFKRLWTGFKKLVERFANFLLRCATGTDTKDLTENIAALKQAVDSKNKEAQDLVMKLCQVQSQLDLTIVSMKNEKEKYSRQIADKQAVVTKYQKQLAGKNKEMAAADAAHKAEEDRLTKERDTYKGIAAEKENVADLLRAQLDSADTAFRAYYVKDQKGGKACDPLFLINAINQYMEALRSGNASSLTGLETSINKEIDRVRNQGIAVVLSEKQVNMMCSNLKKAIEGAENMDAAKDLTGTGYVTAKNVYGLLNESVTATCGVLSRTVQFDKTAAKYVKDFNKGFKQSRDMK